MLVDAIPYATAVMKSSASPRRMKFGDSHGALLVVNYSNEKMPLGPYLLQPCPVRSRRFSLPSEHYASMPFSWRRPIGFDRGSRASQVCGHQAVRPVNIARQYGLHDVFMLFFDVVSKRF